MGPPDEDDDEDEDDDDDEDEEDDETLVDVMAEELCAAMPPAPPWPPVPGSAGGAPHALIRQVTTTMGKRALANLGSTMRAR